VRVAVEVAGGRKEAEGGGGGGEAVREGSPLRDAAAGDAECAPLPLPVLLGDALPGGSEGVGAPGEVLARPLRGALAERVAWGEAVAELLGEPLPLGELLLLGAPSLRVARGDAVAEDDFDMAVANDDGDEEAEAEAEAVAGADAEWLPETLPLPVLLPLRVWPPLPLRRAVGDAQAVARAETEAEALDRGDSLPLTLPLGEVLRLGNTVEDADAEALRVVPREVEAQRVAPDERVVVGEPLPLQEPPLPPREGVPVVLDERVGHAAEGEAQPLLLVEALRVESVLADAQGLGEGEPLPAPPPPLELALLVEKRLLLSAGEAVDERELPPLSLLGDDDALRCTDGEGQAVAEGGAGEALPLPLPAGDSEGCTGEALPLPLCEGDSEPPTPPPPADDTLALCVRADEALPQGEGEPEGVPLSDAPPLRDGLALPGAKETEATVEGELEAHCEGEGEPRPLAEPMALPLMHGDALLEGAVDALKEGEFEGEALLQALPDASPLRDALKLPCAPEAVERSEGDGGGDAEAQADAQPLPLGASGVREGAPPLPLAEALSQADAEEQREALTDAAADSDVDGEGVADGGGSEGGPLRVGEKDGEPHALALVPPLRDAKPDADAQRDALPEKMGVPLQLGDALAESDAEMVAPGEADARVREVPGEGDELVLKESDAVEDFVTLRLKEAVVVAVVKGEREALGDVQGDAEWEVEDVPEELLPGEGLLLGDGVPETDADCVRPGEPLREPELDTDAHRVVLLE
jgi:hypothetical protein